MGRKYTLNELKVLIRGLIDEVKKGSTFPKGKRADLSEGKLTAKWKLYARKSDYDKMSEDLGNFSTQIKVKTGHLPSPSEIKNFKDKYNTDLVLYIGTVDFEDLYYTILENIFNGILDGYHHGELENENGLIFGHWMLSSQDGSIDFVHHITK